MQGNDPRTPAAVFSVIRNGSVPYTAVHRAFQEAAGKPDLVMNDVGACWRAS